MFESGCKNVEGIKDDEPVFEIVVDKSQVLLVLVNVVSDAKHTMKKILDWSRRLTVRIVQTVEQDKEWTKSEERGDLRIYGADVHPRIHDKKDGRLPHSTQ